ncbi:MAG: phosphoribosylaminoimidazolesuccinocarboxamide synthase [Planctomycetota bacterium]
MGNASTLFQSELAPPVSRGKVRDVYALGDDRVLLVASDRVSAFDVVLPTPIPGKGRLLTQIAGFWFRFIEDRGLCGSFLMSTSAAAIPDEVFEGALTTRESLKGRITLGARCDVLPIECVVRGFLEGSGWAEYEQRGSVCGVRLPAGLRRCDELPEPIFTPATKAARGSHDENIDERAAADLVGPETLERVRELSLAIYSQAAAYALERGIIIADTKFEFGHRVDTGELVIVDEALTPDSSRFWPASSYEPGRPQPSFDKQFIREFLAELVKRGEWDKGDPGPDLPEYVVDGTIARYQEARDRLLSE